MKWFYFSDIVLDLCVEYFLFLFVFVWFLLVCFMKKCANHLQSWLPKGWGKAEIMGLGRGGGVAVAE